MTLWIDNQLPPALAGWMRATLSIDCLPVRDLNLQRATDHEIFAAARGANVVVLTKDADFVELLEEHGPPPQVVLVTCGNTSNARLRRLVQMAWPAVVTMLERGEALVERHIPTSSRRAARPKTLCVPLTWDASMAGGRRASNISHLLNDEGYAKRLQDIRVAMSRTWRLSMCSSGRVQGASAPVSPIETSTSARRPPLAPNIRIIEFLADHASLLSDLPSF